MNEIPGSHEGAARNEQRERFVQDIGLGALRREELTYRWGNLWDQVHYGLLEEGFKTENG